MNHTKAIDRLVETGERTVNVLTVQQRLIHAILQYLREQPSFDLARFRVIFSEVKAAAPDDAYEQALLRFLKDFEGPPQ